MTDLTHLSPNAQSLYATLTNAAQIAAQSRGVGYAQIHEDSVGGLGPEMPVKPSDELDGNDPDAQAKHVEATKRYEAALDRYMHGPRAAIEELQGAGVDIHFSAGSFNRYIALGNYRLAVKR